MITWSKLRSPLPWRHKVVNSSLVLPNVGRQDSGEYVCKASNSMGASQVTIKLDVESERWDVGGVAFKVSQKSNSSLTFGADLPSLQRSRTPLCCPTTWPSGSARSSGCSVWPTVPRP